MCCWTPLEFEDWGDVFMVELRRVGGLVLVDVPDGPRGVAHGDVVEVAEEKASRMAASGEWELVNAGPVDEDGD